MKHEMRLHSEPFELIKNRIKTIELRLYDEKRRLIKVNDTIEFENRITQEKILVKVKKLHKYSNFEELYKNFDPISLGYKDDKNVSPTDMNKYYSKEEQEKYGVLGIELELI